MSEMIQVPDGWEIDNFKSLKIKLIDGDRGENYPKEDEFADNGFCVFLSAKNVTKDGFKFNEIQFINKDKDDKLRKGKLFKNDIVLTTRGTVGNIAYFDNTINYNHIRINSGMILLRNENKVLETDYLHIFLKSNIFDNQIANTVFGSAQPQLTVKEIEKFFICFPKEKKEQEKIAKILSTLDKAIESTTRLIEKEKHIKTALMQELLTNGIDQNGQIRTKATHTYKPSELGLIPDEWEVMTLNKISSKISDGIHTTPIYSESSNFYFINGNNLENGKIIITDKTNCVDEEEYNKHKIDLTDKTILLSINGTIGNLAFYKNEKVVLGKSAAYIICKDNINMHFLSFLLSSNAVLQSFELNLTGSTIKNLSIKAIKETRIIYPSMEEQKQIAKILTTQDKKIQTEETNLAKLKELKKGLMNDLLSGKVRVKV